MSEALLLKFHQQYARMMDLPEDDLDLARAALCVSGEAFPGLDIERYLGKLDELASEARSYVDRASDVYQAGLRLSEYLFQREGFSGNERDYYDPLNSYLNVVLDRKLGIPITLSLVYMEVGRRLGLTTQGVGLPGHFVVRLASWNKKANEAYVDPFYGGRLLGREECRRMVEAMSGGRIQLRDAHLSPYTKKQFLARLLTNLKLNYLRLNQLRRAVATADLIALTDPQMATNYRDRGRMLYRLHEYGLALGDMQRYLKLEPSASSNSQVLREMETLRRRVAFPN